MPTTTSGGTYFRDLLPNSSLGDGEMIGAAGGKVGVLGATPVVQADAITAITTGASGTLIATAVNSLITAVKNFGITA